MWHSRNSVIETGDKLFKGKQIENIVFSSFYLFICYLLEFPVDKELSLGKIIKSNSISFQDKTFSASVSLLVGRRWVTHSIRTDEKLFLLKCLLFIFFARKLIKSRPSLTSPFELSQIVFIIFGNIVIKKEKYLFSDFNIDRFHKTQYPHNAESKANYMHKFHFVLFLNICSLETDEEKNGILRWRNVWAFGMLTIQLVRHALNVVHSKYNYYIFLSICVSFLFILSSRIGQMNKAR